MSRLFGAYVIVKWSAAEGKKTGDASVRIGVVKRDVRLRLTYEQVNPATRAEGVEALRAILADLKKRGDRAFVGFDFCLGFPRGSAERMKLSGTPWSAWSEFLAANVVDKADDINNRFSVAAKINRLMTDDAYPFWGCPQKQAQRWMSTTKPETFHGVPEYRLADELLRQSHPKTAPKSLWQMHGAGVVGGQSLLGAPVVRSLLAAAGEAGALWPFTTGLQALNEDAVAGRDIVVGEVFTGLYPGKVEPGETKEQAAIRTLAETLGRLDERGELAALFAGPPKLSDEDRLAAEQEEGWILGVA